jgi:histidyl-tRNA synthetase
MAKLQTIRGMNDISPNEVREWTYVEKVLKTIVESYGYEEIRFPLLEKTELFTRSNEAADIVTKEMYTFQDKGGENISLRPEGTAGCVRAAIANDLLRTDKPRLWYSGAMFRYERPQKGRSRQFHQFSAEVFGHNSPEIDAELMIMSANIWKELDIENAIALEVNNLGNDKSRNLYTDALIEYFKDLKEDFEEDIQRKLIENPLRILDSKSAKVQEILKKAPSIIDFLDDESLEYHEKLLTILDKAELDYVVNPKLVRGLDYYNQTVFEWKTSLLGSQDTVAGGGRYDHLVSELGGKDCPAVGFSIGMERLILLLKEQGKISVKNKLDIYLICQSESATQEAIILRENIKKTYPSLSIKVNLGLEGLGSQFKKADKSEASVAIILGEEELKQNMFSLKNLRTKSDQETLTYKELLEKLNEL